MCVRLFINIENQIHPGKHQFLIFNKVVRSFECLQILEINWNDKGFTEFLPVTYKLVRLS